ncbi:hypothetical protein [Nostoc sp.]|uniref:hypothetical protein n=1 Tax=Nostoc sp. TaxID=1180 RepID=UPI003FA54290
MRPESLFVNPAIAITFNPPIAGRRVATFVASIAKVSIIAFNPPIAGRRVATTGLLPIGLWILF